MCVMRTTEEVDKHCEEQTVIPDWWEFQIQRSKREKRNARWKLDFTRDGWLAQTFTPYGAAAVDKDSIGRLRFNI